MACDVGTHMDSSATFLREETCSQVVHDYFRLNTREGTSLLSLNCEGIHVYR